MITIHKMMKVIICFLVILSCGNVLAGTKLDAELKARTVRQWQERSDLNSCESPQQVIDMWSNDTLQVNGVIRLCDGIRSFIWKGIWAVKNERMTFKIK